MLLLQDKEKIIAMTNHGDEAHKGIEHSRREAIALCLSFSIFDRARTRGF